jgi:ADP-heptose:LPS heptosyltransferase
MSDFSKKEVKRMWILRPDNLGDVVLFSGALRHIRAYYPQAEITLCVKQYVQNLMELCPHVEHIIFWEDILRDMHRPLVQWLPAVRGRERLEYWLHRILIKLKRRTDVLLFPVRSPTPTMHAFIQAMWADARYGIAGDVCNQSASNDQQADSIYTARLMLPQEGYRENEFVITREYLRFIGIEVALDDLWPEFWTNYSDKAWAEKAVPRAEGTFTLAIAPGVTSLLGKFYPGVNYTRVMSNLGGLKFSVVLFGSTADIPMCEEVEYALIQCDNVLSVTNFAGRSTVRQLVEGLKCCDAVLAQETAALHIGVALRKPTVGIMGGGYYGRFYPWGDPAKNRMAHLPMDCYFCKWHCRYSTIRCIQEIRPDSIAGELKAALDLRGHRVSSTRKQEQTIAR